MAEKKRVAVIGGGASGMAVLRAFESAKKRGEDIPEIVCFEKQEDWGGLWNYTWRTGVDQYGENVHGSMYRYLWSNGPKECLEFSDYSFEEHFGRSIPSYPPRPVLRDYIVGRLQKNDVRRYVRFLHSVKNVVFSDEKKEFVVSVRDLTKDDVFHEVFDHVVVCTGHYSTPNVPQFPGFDKFPGRVLHAHDYRDACEFTGKVVLIVGASYSAEDIGSQVMKYGAKGVVFSYRSRPLGFEWPENMEEHPLLTHLEGNIAHFKDGEQRKVDAIILCTGYLHYFPFMSDELRLKSKNIVYPPNLYKGISWLNNDQLFYIGMQDQWYTFNMFDTQAWYARDLIMGKSVLPSLEERQKDISEWEEKQEKITNDAESIGFQTEYVKDLLTLSDYPSFDVDKVNDLFLEWKKHKKEGIMTFRDKSFPSVMTGNMAPKHHTAWFEALDDSLEAFLKDN